MTHYWCIVDDDDRSVQDQVDDLLAPCLDEDGHATECPDPDEDWEVIPEE